MWDGVGKVTNVWVWGRNSDKMFSQYHSLLVAFVVGEHCLFGQGHLSGCECWTPDRTITHRHCTPALHRQTQLVQISLTSSQVSILS